MKTYEERAAAAENDRRSRLSSIAELIEEGGDLVEQQRATLAQATDDSVDFRLSEADREEAATRADKARRRIATLTAAVDALTVKLAERKASAKSKAADDERAAALAERADIAERFKAIIPEAVAAMAGLFTEVQANAARMKKAGLREPDAEACARGIKGHYIGNSPVDWFTAMRIPNFSGKGRAWPVEKALTIGVSDEQAKQRAKAAKANHEARWGLYRARPLSGQAIPFRARVAPDVPAEMTRMLCQWIFTGQMRHEEADRLRALGVTVEVVAADEPGDETFQTYEVKQTRKNGSTLLETRKGSIRLSGSTVCEMNDEQAAQARADGLVVTATTQDLEVA